MPLRCRPVDGTARFVHGTTRHFDFGSKERSLPEPPGLRLLLRPAAGRVCLETGMPPVAERGAGQTGFPAPEPALFAGPGFFASLAQGGPDRRCGFSGQGGLGAALGPAGFRRG